MVRPHITIFSHFYQHNKPCTSSQDGLFCLFSAEVTCHPFVIIFYSHHKYTSNTHFCQFTFLFTSLIPLCNGFPYLNPFANASLNWSGNKKSQARKLLPQIRPFQWYHLEVNQTSTFVDGASAPDLGFRVSYSKYILSPSLTSCSFCSISFFITKTL